jgi:hypothetical protein
MPSILHTIRERLFTKNRFTRFLAHAVGEIVLVVIGILIALQVDNYKDQRKAREAELEYLHGIKADLQANIAKANTVIGKRERIMEAARRVIGKMDGEPITDWKAFNEDCISVYAWQRYDPINYTVEELLNSGGLTRITNDSVRSSLIVLESLYKQAKEEEDHFRYDAETLIWDPVYHLMDLGPLINLHMGKEVTLQRTDYDAYFADKRAKNGMFMAQLEFSTMNGQVQEIVRRSAGLVELIDKELAREER